MTNVDTIKLVYEAFQQDPKRLKRSTDSLCKQFAASPNEVVKARILYRTQPNDFTVAQSLDMTLIYDSIPASDLFETLTGTNEDSYRTLLKNSKPSLNIYAKEDEWEIKQKWVKGPEGSQLWVKKESETDLTNEFRLFVKDYKPKTIKIKSYSEGNDNLAVVCMFDMHLGKIANKNYTNNTDHIYYQDAEYEEEFQKLLWFLTNQKVERILLPIGNDLFNVDNLNLTTVKGTPQDSTKDLHKVFKTGIELLTLSIDALSEIAPVDVVLVPGNHASTVETYLALSLEAIYSNNSNVSIDANPIGRKYYTYGKNLIGLAHGELPLKKYAELLPFEARQQFGLADHVEILVGDKHVEEIYKSPVLDGEGITVRRLAALTKTDLWHYNQGYTLSKRRSYILLYNQTKGLYIQYTNNAD